MLVFGRVTWRVFFLLFALHLHSQLTWPCIATSSELHSSSLTTSGTPVQLEVLPGNDVYLLKNVDIPLVARVRDITGQPVPQVPVTFQVTVGPGMLADMQVPTNEQGEAATSITVPTVLEPTCVVTSVEALSPVTAAFTAVPEEALRLIEVSGNNQVAAPGQVLDKPFVVRVEAQFEAPVVSPCGQPTDPSGPLADQAQTDTSHKPKAVLQQQVRVPVVGVRVAAQIIQGEAAFVPRPGQPTVPDRAEEATNAQGETAFRIQVGDRVGEVVVTRLSALDQAVEFFTAVGFITPLDIAVEADDALVVVDAGLKAVVRVDSLTGDRMLVSGVTIGTNSGTNAVGNGPPLIFPQSVALEADGSFVVVDSHSVVRVAPSTGDRTLVSGPDRGSGPSFASPWSIALEADGSLVVVDLSHGAVIRVSPITGDRTVVSGVDPDTGNLVGVGPRLIDPLAAAIENDGTLVVAEAGFGGLKAVLRVNRNTGNRTVISGVDPDTGRLVGSGPDFASPAGIAIKADGMLVVADTLLNAVVEVEPGTGDRTVVSGIDPSTGEIMGSGPALQIPQGITVETTSALVLVDRGLAAVVRVTPPNGDRTIISRSGTATGPPFVAPRDIAIEAENTLVVIDNGLNAVVRVDPVTGNRTIVSDATTGSGPSFEFPVALAVEADGHLVVADAASVNSPSGLKAIVRVDPVTGNRTIVSDATTGSGPPMVNPQAIAIEANGNLVVIEGPLGPKVMVLRVDPATGNRTIISDATTGSGPSFEFPLDIAIEADGTLVVVGDRRVLRVNPITGNRHVVPAGSANSIAFFPIDLAIEADGHIIIVNSLRLEVERIAPVSGDRMVVSGESRGSGPPFVDLEAIAVEADGNLVVIEGVFGLKAVVRVDPLTGNRTILSR